MNEAQKEVSCAGNAHVQVGLGESLQEHDGILLVEEVLPVNFLKQIDDRQVGKCTEIGSGLLLALFCNVATSISRPLAFRTPRMSLPHNPHFLRWRFQFPVTL